METQFKSEWQLRGEGVLKTEMLCRGTRILAGATARRKRDLTQRWADLLTGRGFVEIELPSIEPQALYVDKAGSEVLGQMYGFMDKSVPPNPICLRPEGTATCQALARKYQSTRDFAVFYVTRCWRYERPQEGRYREFTQFGVEILNPRRDYGPELVALGTEMLRTALPESAMRLNEGTKRGLAYYTDGTGWEVECEVLGAQKQVLGGGPYAEGIGFAIGVDRVLLAMEKTEGIRD
jgi:histidyl-tRNA synthetase